MQRRRYRYVGPIEMSQRVHRGQHCLHVTNLDALSTWLFASLQRGRTHGNVTATFIVDTDAQLWIADRRSEHVACANGQDVLAAGEITFECTADQIRVSEITNQSTGYCPNRESWAIVSEVLLRLGLPHPPHFSLAFEFRRCDQCGATNLIKDDIFECALCNSPLNLIWNY